MKRPGVVFQRWTRDCTVATW